MRHFFQINLLAGLFIIGFASCKQAPGVSNSPATAGSEKAPNIVFLNIDSLLNNYDLYTESRKLLEGESRTAEAAISVKLESFQKRMYDFQKRVYEVQQRAQELAPVQMQALEKSFTAEQQKLAKEEQDLVKRRDNAAQDLEQKLIKLQSNITTRINEHMDKIAAERGYDFVLSKGAGGGLLFGRKQLDITAQTIEELNKLYKDGNLKAENIANEVAKDTVKK